jgi:predicted amidophosphoribosyltransferase
VLGEDRPSGHQRAQIVQAHSNRTGKPAIVSAAICSGVGSTHTVSGWFNEATRILPVPGHTRDKPSVSVMIGALLSRELGIPLTDIEAKSAYRKPAKDMKLHERRALLHEFRIDEDLEGRTVLVLDDVYHTGWTMAGVAHAAEQAGATTVLGLAAARNLKH